MKGFKIALLALALFCVLISSTAASTELLKLLFTTLPTWSSSYNDPSTNPTSWTSAIPAVASNRFRSLRVTNSLPAVSAQVLVVNQVRPHTLVQASIYMRCPSYNANPYLMKFSVAPDTHTAESLALDTNAQWSTVKEFSNTGTNGNGDVFTQYSLTLDTRAADFLSLGFLLSSSEGGIPMVYFDVLELFELSCAPNYFGANCDIFCSNEETCNDHGVCSESGTGCVCDPNFQGSNCDECITGHFGPNCDQTCDPTTTCHGHGTCDSSGQCICSGNFAWPNCSECTSHYFGPNCDTFCDPTTTCHNHGTCDSSGQCICSGNFAWPNCSECTSHYFGPNCDQFCDSATTCHNHGTCDSNGQCICSGNFAWPNCSECTSHHFGPNCDTFCDSKSTCSGHGSCSSSGSCVCDQGWRGNSCDDLICPGSPIECTGHGECNNGTCVCEEGWLGSTCSDSVSLISPLLTCVIPKGSISDTVFTAYFGCINLNSGPITLPVGVHNKFEPEPFDRNQPSTFPAGSFNNSISVDFSSSAVPATLTWTLGAGSVTASTSSPRCDFQNCPNQCSGHGLCLANNQCSCVDGFVGDDCSLDLALVVPILQCVADHNDGTMTAFFTYSNTAGAVLTIPFGPHNHLSGVSAQTQPTVFDTSEPPLFPQTQLKVVFSRDSDVGVAWTLGTTTSSANAESQLCPAEAPLDPLVQCIVPLYATSEFRAFFGYKNPNDYIVTLPIGPANQFFPTASQDLGQPTSFLPGLYERVFSVVFDGDELNWQLGDKVVSVSNLTQKCPESECLHNCSAHGTCVAGTCHCNGGWIGDDCSLSAFDISPVLVCIEDHDNGMLTARFSSENRDSHTLTIPIGEQNFFTPSPMNRNQPTTFPSGLGSTFKVQFSDGDTVTWTLGSNVAHASEFSSRCSPDVPLAPTLYCVDTLAKPQLISFGYENKNNYIVEMTAGSSGNSFLPSPADRGQPSLFGPGIMPIAFNLSVDLDTIASVTWQLNGKSLTVSKASKPACRNIKAVVPRMVSARFANTLLSIEVAFDSATNMAGMNGPGLCDKFFKQSSLGIPGTVKCTWTDFSRVVISLGTNPTVLPGDLLVLTYGFVRDITGTSDYASGNVIILPPLVPLVPTAVVAGPAYVTSCDTLVLDGSGSLGNGGRPLRYLWTVVSKPPKSPLVITSAMRTASAINFQILPTYEGDYVFSLTVTNFVQQSSSAFHKLKITANSKPVVITRPSSPATVSLSQPIFRALGGIQTSRCFPCKWEFRYQWTQTCGTPVKLPGWLGRCVHLRLPTRLLLDSSKYCFTLTATHRRNPAITSSTTLELYTAPILMSVTILGGGQYPRNSKVQLLATVKANSWVVDPKFKWTCTVAKTNGACIDRRTSRALVLPSSRSVSIPKDTLASGSYVFSVLASYKKASASASTSVSFAISNGPSVKIAEVGKYFNPAEQLKLVGSAFDEDPNGGKISYLWHLTRDSCLHIRNRNVLATSITNPTLVVNPNQLSPRRKYSFELQATDRNGVGSASVTVIGGEAPSGGYLRASPTSGVALQTRFTFSLNGWHSSVTSALQYSFSYQIGNRNPVPLSQPSCSNSISVVLPVGKASSYQVKIIGRVQDNLRMFTQVSTGITVVPATKRKQRIVADVTGIEQTGAILGDGDIDQDQLSLDIKSLLHDELQEALESGDDEYVLQLVGIISQVMNGNDEAASDFFDDDDVASALQNPQPRTHSLPLANDSDDMDIRQTLLSAILQINSEANELGMMSSPTDVLQLISSLALVTGSPNQMQHDGQLSSLSALHQIVSNVVNDGIPGLTHEQATTATLVISNVVSAALIQSNSLNSARSVLSTKEDQGLLVLQSAISTVNQISQSLLQNQACDQTELSISTPQISITAIKLSPPAMNQAVVVSPLSSELSVSLPDTIVSNTSDQCNSAQLITWPSTVRMMQSNMRPSSRVFEFSILNNNGQEVSVSNLDKPIQLHVPLTKQALTITEGLTDLHLLTGKCQWWNDAEGAWSTDGCEMAGFSSDGKSVLCQCNHLTQFSIDITRNAPAYGVMSLLAVIFSVYVLVGALIFVTAGIFVVLFIKKTKKHVSQQSRHRLINVELPLGKYALLDEE